MMTVVVNLRHKPNGDYVLIDRRTRWGNPFKIGQHGTREEVIKLYADHLRLLIQGGQVTVEDLAALHGRTLACWCKPLPCHGDVLASAAAWAAGRLRRTP